MNRPVAQVGDGGSFQDWFNSVPPITKVFLVSTVLSGAALTFNWVSGWDLVLNWDLVRNKFQVWRLFTAFIFVGKFSFNFAMHTYILYQNCLRYEANPYNTGAGGNTADFLWMILLSMAVLLVIGYYFEMVILSEPILYVIIYVWSRKEPDAISNIFGFKFKSVYLPWAYVAMRLLMGGSITEPLIGIAVGHLYYFLVAIFPISHGRNLIVTPAFCSDFITWVTGLSLPGRTAAAAPPAARGYRLGGDAGTGRHPAAAAPEASAEHRGGEPVNPNLRQRGAPAAAAAGYAWGRGRTLGSE